MKKLTLLILLVLSHHLPAVSQGIEWANFISKALRGTSAADHTSNSSNMLYVVGNYRTCMGGCTNGYIQKFDTQGNAVFQKDINGPTLSGIEQVEKDQFDNLYIFVYCGGSPFSLGSSNIMLTGNQTGALLKLDSAANVQWYAGIDANYNTKLSTDQFGNSYIFYNNQLLKYNSNGNLAWQVAVSGNTVEANSLHLIVTNSSTNTITRLDPATGNILQSISTSQISDAELLANGDIYYTGNNGTFKITGNSNNFLAAMAGTNIGVDGNTLWLFDTATYNNNVATFIAKCTLNGTILQTDTLENTLGVIFHLTADSRIAISGFLSNSTLPCKWKERFVFSDISSNYNGFVIGYYNPNLSTTVLNFNKAFWDPNGQFKGNWFVKQCPGGSSFLVEYQLYRGSFGNGNIILVQLSDVNGNFTNPTNIGALATTNNRGAISCQLPAGLPYSSTYKMRLSATSPSLVSLQTTCPLDISAPVSTISTGNGSLTFCSKTQNVTAFTTSSTAFCCASSIQWQRNGADIAGATNFSFTPTVTGTYRCIVSDVAGCTSASSNSLNLTVLPLPSAAISPSGNQEICQGDSIIISAPVQTGYTYQWYKNNQVVQNQVSSALTLKTAGNYKVLVTSSNGCTKFSAIKKLTVYKPAIQAFGPTTFCAGGNVVLGSSVNNATVWQWYRNNALISGSTNQYHIATQSGSYKVAATAVSGCTAFSNSIQVSVNCRAEEEIDQETDALSIRPNPAVYETTIEFILEEDDAISLKIIDPQGRLIRTVAEMNHFTAGRNRIQLATDNLQDGMYLIQLTTSKKQAIKRLFIAR